jgi:hypothetical protein
MHTAEALQGLDSEEKLEDLSPEPGCYYAAKAAAFEVGGLQPIY